MQQSLLLYNEPLRHRRGYDLEKEKSAEISALYLAPATGIEPVTTP